MTTKDKRDFEHLAANMMLDAAKELEKAALRIEELEKLVDSNAIAFSDFLLKNSCFNSGFGGWYSSNDV